MKVRLCHTARPPPEAFSPRQTKHRRLWRKLELREPGRDKVGGPGDIAGPGVGTRITGAETQETRRYSRREGGGVVYPYHYTTLLTYYPNYMYLSLYDR